MGHQVQLTDEIVFGNSNPFILIAGMNVLESRDLAFEVAHEFKTVCADLGIPYVFKASFDKANRSSISSFRGPGLVEGLKILGDLKSELNVPLLTDVHEPHQAEPLSEVVDILQVPAFLARQTDLVVATAKTGAVINVKKPQFLAPEEMKHILKKCSDAGNRDVLLCERGSAFGYNNLVVDMLGMDLMKSYAPVVFDATHALQRPGGRSDSADGRRVQAAALARAGMAIGLAGLFLEAHPDPDEAKCDGPCALPLHTVRPFLEQMKALDDLVKGFSPLVTG